MTFPLAKLGFLLMKQLSRPLANLIKNEAKQYPFFRKHVCIPPARAYHWLDMHLKLRKIREHKVSYAPLTEEEEVELGANLLGEVILFSLMSVILLFELGRQGDIKASKEKMKEEEIKNVVDTISDLMADVNELKEAVAKLEKKLNSSFDDFLDLENIRVEAQQEDPRVSLKDVWRMALRWKKHSEYDEAEVVDPLN